MKAGCVAILTSMVLIVVLAVAVWFSCWTPCGTLMIEGTVNVYPDVDAFYEEQTSGFPRERTFHTLELETGESVAVCRVRQTKSFKYYVVSIGEQEGIIIHTGDDMTYKSSGC